MNRWFDHLMLHTRSRVEQPALVMEDRVVTYGMLAGAIERCGRRILQLNLAGDQPIAVLVKNPIRHLALCLALFRIGRRSVSLEHGQTGIGGLRFAAVLGDAQARGSVTPDNRIVDVTDAWFADDAPAREVLPQPFSSAAQVCRISLTSGTTGAAKQVAQRVADVGSRIESFIDINWTVGLCLPGLASNYGFTSACAGLATGRTVCFAESAFQAVRMIDAFAVDLVVAAPEQLLAVTRIARKTGARLHSLRRVEIAGSVASRALLEAASIHVCNNIGCRYGASETGVMARTTARELLAQPGLAGWPEPGVEVGVFDASGNRCPAGQPGLIRIRREDPAGEAGWAELGDVGWIAPTGQLHVLGRSTDASSLGPEVSLVYELEHLMRLEWDMTDGAAVFVDDEAGGPAQLWVGTVDATDASAEKLAAIARQRGIAHPIRMFPIPVVPRGTNGKVNRSELKTRLLALAGTQA